MLCKHQEILEGSCRDSSSRAVRCKAGYATICMKHCNEACEKYERIELPVRTSLPYRSTPAKYNPYGPTPVETRVHGGCGTCGK